MGPFVILPGEDSILYFHCSVPETYLYRVGTQVLSNQRCAKFTFQDFVIESTLGSNIIFLSSDDQKSMNNDFVDALPWKNFGRKNVGYLYAVSRGAKVIWDFDDDNFLKFWICGAAVEPSLDVNNFANASVDCKYSFES